MVWASRPSNDKCRIMRDSIHAHAETSRSKTAWFPKLALRVNVAGNAARLLLLSSVDSMFQSCWAPSETLQVDASKGSTSPGNSNSKNSSKKADSLFNAGDLPPSNMLMNWSLLVKRVSLLGRFIPAPDAGVMESVMAMGAGTVAIVVVDRSFVFSSFSSSFSLLSCASWSCMRLYSTSRKARRWRRLLRDLRADARFRRARSSRFCSSVISSTGMGFLDFPRALARLLVEDGADFLFLLSVARIFDWAPVR
mmetsp:Transcript_46443/g.68636  ORF Transcript_46443/g.68636 Transcript_46443/m.68636 type:complete len:252 (-) Transcript_46443:148-903(-)